MKKLLQALVALLIVTGSTVSATGVACAALVNEPVPENAYISVGGYDVAWASPCQETLDGCGLLDLSYQSQFGWEAMSTNLFGQLRLSATDFVVAGGNVDYATGNNFDEVSGTFLSVVEAAPPTGDLALAVAYFSTYFSHADWDDGLAGDWAPVSNATWADSLVVRRSATGPGGPSAVPELSASGLTSALALLGGSALLFDRRRAARTA